MGLGVEFAKEEHNREKQNITSKNMSQENIFCFLFLMRFCFLLLPLLVF